MTDWIDAKKELPEKNPLFDGECSLYLNRFLVKVKMYETDPPEDYELFVAYRHNGEWCISGVYDDYRADDCEVEVIAWMPIPE